MAFWLTAFFGFATLLHLSSAAPTGEHESILTERYIISIECSDSIQQATLLRDLKLLAYYAKDTHEWLASATDFDASKNFYNHYFRPEDRYKVMNAFTAFRQAPVQSQLISFPFIVHCAAADDPQCSDPEELAHADATPEDYIGGGSQAGTRDITICPSYFQDTNTKRMFPLTDGDIAAYCQGAADHSYDNLETGTHTLMHEISHLDRFGLFAVLPRRHKDGTPAIPGYDYHGTDDFQGFSDPQNARDIREDIPEDFELYWNAESLAAFALEFWASKYCGIDDVQIPASEDPDSSKT